MARVAGLARCFPSLLGLKRGPSLLRTPLARGFASAPVDAAERRDRIELRDLAFHAFHGVLPEERTLGQIFQVDVTMFCDLRKAGASDEVEDTTDYSEIFKQVRQIMEGDPVNLIEHLAERIAQDILKEHARVKEVEVEVRKPQCAIPGMHASHVGVAIRRP
ncbi:hypothetical protein BSKO_01923 [Bryopsis sp. KO-2023]|nr:hypothetical protein BSKO_01923 [Bryopsis sp. KO-2023]